MDLQKFYRRRMKRLKRSIKAPLEQSRAVQKIWKLMGAQGVLIHMGRQGRWNVWLAFVLSLISLAILLGLMQIFTLLEAPLWSWLIAIPFMGLSAFVHYALWRATRYSSSLTATVMRLYAAPMLTLIFFFLLGFIVVSLNEGLNFLLNNLKETLSSLSAS